MGDNKVFLDAPDLYPAIHVVKKKAPTLHEQTRAAVFEKGATFDDFDFQLENRFFGLSVFDQSDDAWQLGKDDERKLFEKISGTQSTLENHTNGQMFVGIKTALNQVFVIDTTTKTTRFSDKRYLEFIKPMLAGLNLRPWYQAYAGEYVIAIPTGWTSSRYGRKNMSEEEAWHILGQDFPELTSYLAPYADRGRLRQDKGEYWWELRPCAYYDAFDKPKIMWPDITKFPRFSWDESSFYLGNTGYILVTDDKWLLAYLNSRCAWYLISKTSIALGERAGLQRYRLIDQYMRPLPVPVVPESEQGKLSGLADGLTQAANARFRLQQETRHRISSDLGSPEYRLNEKLTNWWESDFATFRAEIKRVFKRDVPLKERTNWEQYLDDARRHHETYTAEIVRMETELNAIVYQLFDLTPAEIKIIEESTKYKYGEI